MRQKRIVITGLGVVSSLGMGWRNFWESLLAGRSGIRKIRHIDTSEYPTQYGGEVVDFDPVPFMPVSVASRLGRGSQFAIAAARMALDDAGLTATSLGDACVGVCLGTTMADIQALESIDDKWVKEGERSVPASLITQYPGCTISANVGKHFDLTGPNVMIPTACAAGNYAIGYGLDLLRSGRADAMVVGGVDPFSRIAFTGFNRIFAVAPERCQPFDKNRQGTLIGEGAGILLLETLENARARGAAIYAEILGYGQSCDAHHMTIPNPDGVEQVIRNALKESGIGPAEINYISAHGTGTPANDRTECAAIHRVFRDRATKIPISSIKSMLGHTMGAASALEAIACALVAVFCEVPPTVNYEVPDPECEIDCVPNHSRKENVQVVLNNSFAFGGNNACLAIAGCNQKVRALATGHGN